MNPKEHTEFHTVDLTTGWHSPEGYPDGLQQKILAGDLDEEKRTGSQTRLLRFNPGAFSTRPFVHDYWEEVYVLEGTLTVGCDEHGDGGVPFPAHTYACRPPGVLHGPFSSVNGCLLLEFHYYDSRDIDSVQ